MRKELVYLNEGDFYGTCPVCDGEMYMDDDGDAICKTCGHLINLNLPDYMTDDAPEGCQACGGPYPMCKDGCNLFDD